ncbi:hypothetical protein BV25DRAFT_161268 [Artomyces pyxidatus]|uniref:Uncharacterized protein n=1 Tax=Artomyces pyxidatus TaxID=48021 RepID=A0ACB8TAW1_9AGAM|nr:hypothetical protein BV25DRAFT_161268 [Artomyces pyxidatus]
MYTYNTPPFITALTPSVFLFAYSLFWTPHDARYNTLPSSGTKSTDIYPRSSASLHGPSDRLNGAVLARPVFTHEGYFIIPLRSRHTYKTILSCYHMFPYTTNLRSVLFLLGTWVICSGERVFWLLERTGLIFEGQTCLSRQII